MQGTAALGAAAAFGGLSGCGDNVVGTALVLEVDATRALVAAWAANTRLATVTITSAAGAPAGRWSMALGGDGTGWVDATGLAPATSYVARVATGDGYVIGDFAFTTAPRDDDPRPLRLAVSADVDENPAFASPIFDAIIAARPDFFVSLGDWPYTDNAPPAYTRDAYHARYVQNRLEPRFAAWQRATSFRCIYDDHELANDWDGAMAIEQPRRLADALATWDAWFPHRGGPRYRSWRWGALVECFLLDCRTFRSANADPDGPAKTMLGAEQHTWLTTGLAASTAAFCLVFTSVPLDFGRPGDHWSSFVTERDALLDAIGRPGVLFLSGDQHFFAAHRHRRGLRELQFGPLSRDLLGQPATRPEGVLARISSYNAGMIDIDATPRLTARAIGPTGETLYTESFTPADLAPR